tara:strand:+ start:250 stop:1722 length:1473 start_codon:yes stop_codon:yes gene_type:complete
MAEAEEENKKIEKSEEKINDAKKKSIKSSQQLKQLASDIGQAISDTSKAQTSFQKSLGLSVGESLKLTNQLAKSATFSKNLNVSFAQTAKAVGLINSSLGIGTKLVAKQAEDIGRFALSLGLSEKSQANLAKRSIQTGKSVEGLVLSQIKVAKNVEAEFGTRLNIAEVIDKANQLSGQVRAQLGGNVEELTRAVSVAKELGFELESIAGSSKALLNFQSNIEAELEAELLTGRQLNLEQARLFALTGDYEGLTREIAANVGDFYEFSKLNVLQQDAIAKSVGMTSDQLSDQLFNQSSITELKEKARKENDKETLARLEQLDIEKQFSQLLLKVQGAFVSIASNMGFIFKGFDFLVKNADLVLGAFLGMKAAMLAVSIYTRKTALSAALAAAFKNPLTALAGAAIGVSVARMVRSETKKVDDLMIPPGGATHVTGPAGRFKLNSQDALVAGTNLGGNDNRRSDAEIVALATRSIRVNLNTTELSSISTVVA